jgi:hypothetical protein
MLSGEEIDGIETQLLARNCTQIAVHYSVDLDARAGWT